MVGWSHCCDAWVIFGPVSVVGLEVVGLEKQSSDSGRQVLHGEPPAAERWKSGGILLHFSTIRQPFWVHTPLSAQRSNGLC